MYILFALGNRESFAALRRDQINLADVVFIFGIRVGIGLFTLARRLALGEEGDPFAVLGPLGIGVVAGLRELNQSLAVFAVKPEIGAKDLLIPIGAVGGKDDGATVRREFDRTETH